MKKRLLYLIAGALVAMVIMVPSVFGQETTGGKTGQVKQKLEEKIEATTEAPLPKSGGGAVGGSAVVFPAAAALLLGSGVLAYAALRRRH